MGMRQIPIKRPHLAVVFQQIVHRLEAVAANLELVSAGTGGAMLNLIDVALMLAFRAGE